MAIRIQIVLSCAQFSLSIASAAEAEASLGAPAQNNTLPKESSGLSWTMKRHTFSLLRRKCAIALLKTTQRGANCATERFGTRSRVQTGPRMRRGCILFGSAPRGKQKGVHPPMWRRLPARSAANGEVLGGCDNHSGYQWGCVQECMWGVPVSCANMHGMCALVIAEAKTTAGTTVEQASQGGQEGPHKEDVHRTFSRVHSACSPDCFASNAPVLH